MSIELGGSYIYKYLPTSDTSDLITDLAGLVDRSVLEYRLCNAYEVEVPRHMQAFMYNDDLTTS